MSVKTPNVTSGDASKYFGLPPGSVSWAYLEGYLRHGPSDSLHQLKIKMGLAEPPKTKKGAETAILSHYLEHGERPHKRSSKELYNWDQWLLRRGSSVSRLGTELGLPGAPTFRTLEKCEAAILGHYEKHGGRPLIRDGVEWRQWSQWLNTHQGSSLDKLCNKLGLPGGMDWGRTLERCKTEIGGHYEKHGQRPSRRVQAWKNWDQWLRNHHKTTVHKLCDELGLPGGAPPPRTWGECKVAILAYYKKYGKRPGHGSRKWANWNSWLYRRGSSLRKFCDELGLV